MHWVPDVSMSEDTCQIDKDHEAENLSCLRHMRLNMLRAETMHDEYIDVRGGIECKF